MSRPVPPARRFVTANRSVQYVFTSVNFILVSFPIPCYPGDVTFVIYRPPLNAPTRVARQHCDPAFYISTAKHFITITGSPFSLRAHERFGKPDRVCH